jgi:predicted transcriptional regulator
MPSNDIIEGMAGERITRQFTISLPPELAVQVQELADHEHRTISELFREAFRSYRADRVRELFREAQTAARVHAPDMESEQDVEQAVKQLRRRGSPRNSA